MKKKTKSVRKVKVAKAPSVPEFAIWTDEIDTGGWFMLWPKQNAEAQPTYEAAVKEADARVKGKDTVRLVGIYKLVATVRPDRSPVITTLEERGK